MGPNSGTGLLVGAGFVKGASSARLDVDEEGVNAFDKG